MIITNRRLLHIILSLGLFIMSAGKAEAIVDPLAQPNNKVGIHISDESDIDLATELVNSNGGDWGYVTIVIRDDQKDVAHWQPIFDKLREKHLIPIVRLATHTENGVWVKPQAHEVGEWVGFLNRLNWVVKNRYVILFNEPNHAKEWGGQVNPEEYTQIAKEFHKHLKQTSPDFFVLPAGMDAAAPNGPATMDSRTYFDRMYQESNQIFTLFDGWVSHAYPNPAFSGSPADVGKATIRGHEWELNFLKQYGLQSDVPVFITETGWMHQEGKIIDRSLLSTEQVAEYFKTAFNSVWAQSNVVAVTPFILNYQDYPFDYFSFIKINSRTPLPHFTAIKELKKSAGQPIQVHRSEIDFVYWPETLITGNSYSIALTVKNTGQSIWESDQVKLDISSDLPKETISVDEVPPLKPGESEKMWLHITTPEEASGHSLIIQLSYNDKSFGSIVGHSMEVVPPTNLLIRTKLWLQRMIYPQDFTISLKQAASVILSLAHTLFISTI